MSELACSERVSALRAGMASVIPVQMLPLMSPWDADLRICGLPEVNLDFLKVGYYTKYTSNINTSSSDMP